MADNPVLPRFLQSVAKLRHRVNSAATDVGQRQRINWVDSATVAFTLAESSVNEEVTVTPAVVAGSLDTSFFASPAWTTTHSPVVTSQTGTLTTVGAVAFAYQKIGRTVIWRCSIVITTNGTGATSILFTLPFAIVAGTWAIGYGREIVLTGKTLGVLGVTSSGVATYYDNSYPGGDGASLVMNGSYQATS